jgi:hypothetical protein
MAISPSRRLIIPKRDATPRGFRPAQLPLVWPIKSPGATLDYSINIAQLLDSTDSVAAVSAAVLPDVPGGLTIDDTDVFGTTATVWLTGGVDGTDYEVQVTLSSDAGRIEQMNIAVRVENLSSI